MFGKKKLFSYDLEDSSTQSAKGLKPLSSSHENHHEEKLVASEVPSRGMNYRPPLRKDFNRQPLDLGHHRVLQALNLSSNHDHKTPQPVGSLVNVCKSNIKNQNLHSQSFLKEHEVVSTSGAVFSLSSDAHEPAGFAADNQKLWEKGSIHGGWRKQASFSASPKRGDTESGNGVLFSCTSEDITSREELDEEYPVISNLIDSVVSDTLHLPESNARDTGSMNGDYDNLRPPEIPRCNESTHDMSRTSGLFNQEKTQPSRSRCKISVESIGDIISGPHRKYLFDPSGRKSLLKSLRDIIDSLVSKEKTLKRWNAEIDSVEAQIECCVKTAQVRWRFRLVYRRKRSAICIQKWFRAISQQNKYLAFLKARKKYYACAVIIQSRFRAHSKRNEYLRTRNNLIKMQSAWRMHRQYSHFISLRESAIYLQAYIRMTMAKAQYRKVMQSFRHIAVCVKLRYRMKSNAAIIIQRRRRGTLARKRFLEMKRKLHVLHRFLLRVRNRNKMNRAATMIQKNTRMYLSLKRVQTLKNEAARLVQAMWKMHYCQKKYASRLASTKRAILTISSAYALYRIRKKRLAAVTKIQKAWNDHFISRSRNCTVLQAIVRGHIQRKRFSKKREACILVQSSIRQGLAVRVMRKLREKREACAIIIQKTFRTWICRNYFLKLMESIIQIQYVYRRALRRRKLKVLETKVNAATTIQLWIRLRLKQKECQRMRMATRLQAWVRCLLARRRYRCIQVAVKQELEAILRCAKRKMSNGNSEAHSTPVAQPEKRRALSPGKQSAQMHSASREKASSKNFIAVHPTVLAEIQQYDRCLEEIRASRLGPEPARNHEVVDPPPVGMNNHSIPKITESTANKKRKCHVTTTNSKLKLAKHRRETSGNEAHLSNPTSSANSRSQRSRRGHGLELFGALP